MCVSRTATGGAPGWKSLRLIASATLIEGGAVGTREETYRAILARTPRRAARCRYERELVTQMAL